MAKRLKQSTVSEIIEAEDRISNIPDVLLAYILSFVSTKEAVRTSILSTRWKPLWAQVPVLDLRNWEFPPTGGDSVYQEQRKANYLTFVDRFLSQSKPSSVKVLIRISGRDLSLIDSWISVAKKQNIEELLLEMNYDHEPRHPFFPRPSRISLFISFSHLDTDPPLQNKNGLANYGKLHITTSTCDWTLIDLWVSVTKTCNLLELQVDGLDQYVAPSFNRGLVACQMFVVLKLQGLKGFKFPTFSFPKLKVLHLKKIFYKESNSLSYLNDSIFPLLEELDIERKYSDNITHLIIKSQTLRCLRLCFQPESDRYYVCKTLIDAPALQYLDLQGEISEIYVGQNISELIEAKVDVAQTYYSLSERTAVLELIRKSFSVRRLVLSNHTMEALRRTNSCYHLLTFPHLTSLEISVVGDSGAAYISWKLVLEFLWRSPQLKHLTFQCILFSFDEQLGVEVPNCLLSRLETIKFYCLRIEEDELTVARYFLENCKMLKKMSMYFCPKAIKKQVLALPRRSPACQIEFCRRYQ